MARSSASRSLSALVAVGLSVTLLALIALWSNGLRAVAPDDRLEVAGIVRAETIVVAAPVLRQPAVDYAVGLPRTSAPAPSPATGGVGRGATAAALRSPVPTVSGMISSVTVGQGDRVTAGQIVAGLDTTVLDLGVEAARAARRRAQADVGVLEESLDEVDEKRADLSDARVTLARAQAELTEARDELERARAKLVASRKKARAARAALKSQIAALERQLSQPVPPQPPTGTPQPNPAQLLAALKAKLAQIEAGIAKLDAGIDKIDRGLAKVADGFDQVRSARATLASGRSALAEAQDQLEAALDVLGVVADTRALGVEFAQAAREQATLRAPVSGTVVAARLPGTVAVVGAPVVRIAPDGPARIDTYLTAEQLARVRLGAAARVSLDSRPGEVFSARVTGVGTELGFAPTRFPTELIHMTRAAKVTATVEGNARLPAGTPVDLTIETARR